MSHTKKIVFAAIMVAVGILLPMVFHAIPNAGSVFAPMHLPVLVAGFICGPLYGILVGLICPLLSFIMTVLDIYLSLIISLLVGRIMGGFVAYMLFLGGRRDAYSWTIFFTTYFVTCWPALIIQIVVVPTAISTPTTTKNRLQSKAFSLITLLPSGALRKRSPTNSLKRFSAARP